MKTSDVFDYATGSTSKQATSEERQRDSPTRNIDDPFLQVLAATDVDEKERKELVLTNRSMVSKDSFENDPDRPANAINSTLIVEEIDINGLIQKVHKKTYQLLDGTTKVVTKISTE